ncbi:MAG: cation:proton antiporter [Burkholderiaceae bacterium]
MLIALVAWLPLALRRVPLSLPIVCIALGALLFSLPQVAVKPLPGIQPVITERLTEFVVIIALMGAGLKLDRAFDWRRWHITWRLLGITMPLGIVAITAIGGWLMGLPWVLALLVGAALAPTDPVLAADVQVGPPKTGEEDEVRFGLTSEAGLNDGLAFPFVHLALALALHASAPEPWLAAWFAHSVIWEIAAAIFAGWAIGRGFGWLTFHVPAKSRLAQTGDGLIAIAATLIAYGLAEIIDCYGFLAVFVAALSLRQSHRDHDFHRQMHDFTDQIERMVMMGLLLLFGGALVDGLLAPLQWVDVVAALLVIVVVRPLTGMAALMGAPIERREKRTLAFFGIRGVGSFYYIAYGVNRLEPAEADRLWAFTGFVVLLSILIHGLTVTPIMRSLDRRQGRDPDRTGRAAPASSPAAVAAAEPVKKPVRSRERSH